jgi:hypothetical protein
MNVHRLAMVSVLTVCTYSAFAAGAVESASSLVSGLIDNYKAVETVQLQAAGDVKIFDAVIDGQKEPGVRNVHSDLTYVAKNECYFIDTKWDPTPNYDYKIAFDGKRYQELNRPTSRLTILVHDPDPDQNPVHPDLPLFYPVQFLNVTEDGHLACPIKLGTVQDVSLVGKAEKECRWLDEGQMAVELPGRVRYSRPTTWQVYFGGGVVPYLPKRVRHVDNQGNVLEELIFDDYKAAIISGGKKVYYPEITSRILKTKENAVFLEEKTHITACAFNQSIDDSKFVIDFDEARSIWDGDAHKFIAEKGGIQPPQEISGITLTNDSSPPVPALVASGSNDEARKKSLWFWLSLMGGAILCFIVSVLYLVHAMRPSARASS